MTASEEQVIAHAMEVLARAMGTPGELLGSPQLVKRFLTLRLARLEREVFGALWLTPQNQLIAADDLFFGTQRQVAVYVREVAKQALRHNAASLICYHNHPGGRPWPSEVDLSITATLHSTLNLLDVRLLDHVIVAGLVTYSFAEHGELHGDGDARRPASSSASWKPSRTEAWHTAAVL